MSASAIPSNDLPSVTLRLRYPIKFETGFAAAVSVRPLWEAERSKHADPNMREAEDMALATGLPIDAIMELDAADYDSLWAVFWPLLDATQGRLQPPKIEARYVN